jgi:hypothetical protein
MNLNFFILSLFFSLNILKIYLGIAQNSSLFVHNSGTIRINQLIENNNKAIVRFWLNKIQINEEIIE